MQPFDAMRQAIRSTARRASEEAAAGAVRGVRQELPEELAAAEGAAAEVLTGLADLLHDLEAERPLQQFLQQLTRLTDRLDRFLVARTDESRDRTGAGAKALAASAMEGVLEALRPTLHRLHEDGANLQEVTDRLATGIGRAFALSIASAVSEARRAHPLPIARISEEVTSGVLNAFAARLRRVGPVLAGMATCAFAGGALGYAAHRLSARR